MDPESFHHALRAGPRLPPLKPPGGPIPLEGHFTTVLRTTLDKLSAGDPSVAEFFAHVHDEFATLYDGRPKGCVCVWGRSELVSLEGLSGAKLGCRVNEGRQKDLCLAKAGVC